MTIITILILIISIVAHEVSHGFAALWQGDTTARDAGRLTLNPMAHIDFFGSIVLPVGLFLLGSPFLFGYAKPVPINGYNFRNVKYGEALVAFAGPLVNIIIALAFSLLLHTVPMSAAYVAVAQYVVLINLVLALFNLLPVPPLDGSKILFAFIPQAYYKVRKALEAKSFIFWIVVMVLVWQLFEPVVYWVFDKLV